MRQTEVEQRAETELVVLVVDDAVEHLDGALDGIAGHERRAEVVERLRRLVARRDCVAEKRRAIDRTGSACTRRPPADSRERGRHPLSESRTGRPSRPSCLRRRWPALRRPPTPFDQSRVDEQKDEGRKEEPLIARRFRLAARARARLRAKRRERGLDARRLVRGFAGMNVPPAASAARLEQLRVILPSRPCFRSHPSWWSSIRREP